VAAAGALAVSASVGTVATAGTATFGVTTSSAVEVVLGATVAAAAGALEISAAGGTVAAGAAAATVGVTARSGGVATVAAGTAEAAAGALVVSVGAGIVAAGTAAATGGGIAVSVGVLIEPAGAAVAAAQCSEIIFSEVTAKLPLAAPAVAFCPMRVTSWPRCGLRSTLLVVSLKLWPVLSSARV
jgi:hypothetical protein